MTFFSPYCAIRRGRGVMIDVPFSSKSGAEVASLGEVHLRCQGLPNVFQ